MEPTSSSIKPKQSSSSKDLKKNSSAAIRNSNYSMVIKDNDKHAHVEDMKTKKSADVIILHEKKSHNSNDIHNDSKGDTAEEYKFDPLPKRSRSKNNINEEVKGNQKSELINNRLSTNQTSSDAKTSNVHQQNKDTAKEMKTVKDAAGDNTISYFTRMTRSRLRQLLNIEHGKKASDYLNGLSANTKILSNVQFQNTVGQKKRPGNLPKSAQVKRVKK